MEQKKPVSHIAAGLIIAAVLVVYSILLNFLSLSQNQALGWLAYVILIGGLAFFITQYGKSRDYTASFGQLFSYGFKATSIITLVMILFIVLFFVAFPEFKDKILEASREGMEQQGKMTDEQIDEAMGMVNRNFIIFTGGGVLFMYLILGAIGSLIGAAITKKRPQTPFDQQSI